MTKIRDCKFFGEGRCVDAVECLYKHGSEQNQLLRHVQQKVIFLEKQDCNMCDFNCTTENEMQTHMKKKHSTKESCKKCPKEFSNKFEIKTHIWRSHEEIECNLCDESVASRHVLKRHKEVIHRVKMTQDCKYFKEGYSVNSDKCLFNHNIKKTATSQKLQSSFNVRTEFCKEVLKCPRVDCEYEEDQHRRIKDASCKFQERCKKPECLFKYEKQLVFYQSGKNKRGP